MKISDLCIRRPVLATVMSLVLVLMGLMSLARLRGRANWAAVAGLA